MMVKRLPAVLIFLAVCAAAAVAQVPTPGQVTPTAKPTVTDGKPGLVRLIDTNSFREKIFELKQKRDKLNTEFEPRNQKLAQMQADITNLDNELQKQGQNLTAATREQKARRLE